jgi:hypothetical protein
VSDSITAQRAIVTGFSYRWTVRGADPRLVRLLKIRAIEQERSVAELLNEALRGYLYGPEHD